MEPIIEIVTNDGRRIPTGEVYVRGWDGANAEATKIHNLPKGSYKLECVGWTRSTAGLGGCGTFSFG